MHLHLMHMNHVCSSVEIDCSRLHTLLTKEYVYINLVQSYSATKVYTNKSKLHFIELIVVTVETYTQLMENGHEHTKY